MDELKSTGKPFEISKWEVWEAWQKVKANKGAPGVDGYSIADFEADLKNNLFKIWNRMSSGSYFPPPVLAVEIPKPHGGGMRVLGVPTVADRVAQTVVARRLRPPEVRRVVELKQSMIVKVGTRRQPLYVVRRREEGPTCELICE